MPNTLMEGKAVGPYEFMQMIFLAVAGMWSVIVGPPASVRIVMHPDWYRTVWCWLLFFGAIATLAGLFWAGRRITAYTIEQVGQLTVAGTTAMYVIALFDVHPADSTIFPALYISSLVACAIYRTYRLEKFKRELVAAQRMHDQKEQ